MPKTPPVLPDAELVIVQGLTSVVGSLARVVTKLPATVTNPVARVKRIGGPSQNIFSDQPLVDIDVFSNDYASSSNVSRNIQSLLMGLRGRSLEYGVIQNVKVVQAPRWLPEPDPNLTRFGATYEVLIHNNP